MTDAKERLSRLIELAARSAPEDRRALAFELCDLLIDWPIRYPTTMREPFEALLENALRRLDGTTRRMIAARLAIHPATALSLLNEFFFETPAEARAIILQRNAETGEAIPTPADLKDEKPLIEAARHIRGAELAAALGRFLRIPPAIAQRILDDTSGNALAVACKGADVSRATYSALALLTSGETRVHPTARYARLSAIDVIPAKGAEQLLAYWRRAPVAVPAAESNAQAAA